LEDVELVSRMKMKETIHDMEMSYGTTGSLFRSSKIVITKNKKSVEQFVKKLFP
jgi:hypothetical protein